MAVRSWGWVQREDGGRWRAGGDVESVHGGERAASSGGTRRRGDGETGHGGGSGGQGAQVSRGVGVAERGEVGGRRRAGRMRGKVAVIEPVVAAREKK